MGKRTQKGYVLMPTIDYRNELGEKVPGTTGPIGRFKDSGGLIQWAYKTGREHGDLAARGLPAPKGLYDVTNAACETGTLAHALVEAHIQRREPTKEALADPRAVKAFEAYLEWQSSSKVEIIETEINLVSEQYQYGGCPDAIGTINGKPVLLDWKTSNGLYSDHLIQLAAYGHLLLECRGIKVTGNHLLRFAKENGDFHHHYFESLADEWEAFMLIRKLYDLDKRIKKRAR